MAQIQIKQQRFHYTTNDFSAMVKCIIWSSTGFFFLEFVFTQFAKLLGIGGVQLGLIFSFITVGNIISSPLVGWLNDKYKKRTLILIGVLGRGLSYFLMYVGIIFKSLGLFLVSTLFLGFMVVFFWIPFNSLLAEKSHMHHRSKAYAQRDFAIGKGMMIGGLLGFAIFELGDYLQPDALWLVYFALPLFALMNFYAGLLFYKQIDEKKVYIYPVDENQDLEHLSPENDQVMENQSFSLEKLSKIFKWGLILLFIGFFLGSINGNLAKPFLQLYISENITADPTFVMLIYFPSGLFSMLLAPKMGKLADKVKPVIGLTFTASMGALVTFLLIRTVNPIIFAFILIIDVTIARTEGLILDNFISRISRKHRGKLFGAKEVFINLGSVIGPILGGLLWDSLGYAYPFIISIFVELAIVPILLLGIKFVKPEMEEK